MPVDQSVPVPEQRELEEINPEIEIRETQAKRNSLTEQDLQGDKKSTKTRQKGPPLALRRLLDFNKKDLKE